MSRLARLALAFGCTSSAPKATPVTPAAPLTRRTDRGRRWSHLWRRRLRRSGLSPAAASCIGEVVKLIEFPKPKGGGVVNVSYPFVFEPG